MAIQQGDRWLLHAGDAYYLRAELTEDDLLRRSSLSQLCRLVHDHGDRMEMFGYHDFCEL